MTANWRGTRLRPSFDTEQEARVYKAQQMERMAKGLDICMPTGREARVNVEGKPVTLKQLFEYTKEKVWLTGGPNGQPKKSAKSLIIAAEQAVVALGPSTKFMTLDFFKIENALENLRRERGNSPSTTVNRKSSLSVMLGEAEKLYPEYKRPAIDRKVKSRTRHFRILPGLEDTMLQWALAKGWVDFYDFIVLALYCGQRENEVLRLRLEENVARPLDGYIEDGFAVFPAQDAANKSATPRAIPLRAVVEEVINRRRAISPDPKGRILEGVTKGNIDYWWRTMREDLINHDHPDIVSQKQDGFPIGKDFVPHILRHEFCSRLGDEGFSIHEIQQYSGHETAKMCQRYVKPHKVVHRNRLARMGQITPGLPGGGVPTYAPTTPLPKIAVNNPAPVQQSQPVLDADALARLATALQDAGLGHILQEAMAGRQTKTG